MESHWGAFAERPPRVATHGPDLGNASGGREMDTNVAYGLMIATLGIFGYIAYQATHDEK